ncbi:ThrRS/AlaRS common domain-containing protein [Neoconidiobolus thromboides FSU 785]|nr:ThrRS/AlaRS common domain-containing protein [Neoconidiobolus thromboides FSU 785]
MMGLEESVKRVGELKCQLEPYVKEYCSKVANCEKVGKHYEVELFDTILFPEGGGQPWDLGTINDKKVIKVLRKGLKCVHVLENPLEIGEEVKIILDFNRRFDHMQQHSGQHLLSAIFEKHYNLDTTSWYMGSLKNYIQLPIKESELTKEIIEHVEKLCSEKIREAIPVTVKSYDLGDPNVKRPTSLPDDYGQGIIREIIIDDIDVNPCCGTHVKNTSELQVIKLLNVDRQGSDNVRLNFIVGQRVLDHYADISKREQKLVSTLNAKPELLAAKAEQTIQANKDMNKQLKNMNLELTLNYKNDIINRLSHSDIVCCHHPYTEMDFIKIIKSEFQAKLQDLHDNNKLVLVSGGSKSGPLMILGNTDMISHVLKLIENVPKKGAMTGDMKWQGKCTDLDKLLSSYNEIEKIKS